MNGYERMLATLHKEKVDHTPSMEIMIDQKIIDALTDTGDYMDLCDALDLNRPKQKSGSTVPISVICRKKPRGTIRSPLVILWPIGGKSGLSRNSTPPRNGPDSLQVQPEKLPKILLKRQRRRRGRASGRRLLLGGTETVF